jgi:hypothetical protein
VAFLPNRDGFYPRGGGLGSMNPSYEEHGGKMVSEIIFIKSYSCVGIVSSSRKRAPISPLPVVF